jgi:hypothetical protein
VVDTAKHEVATHWPIAPGEEESGMAIDTKLHRLFLGCGNKRVVMLDYTNGKVLGSVTIGAGVDGNAFDPTTQLAFASCGDGTTAIAGVEAPDNPVVVQRLKTATGSRTMTIDPATHRIYLPAAEFEPAAKNQRRPKAIAGSYMVLVFELAQTNSLPIRK